MFRYIVVICAVGYAFLSFIRSGSDASVSFPMTRISGTTPVKELPMAKKIRVFLFTGTEWCPACKHLDGNVIEKEEWKDFAKKELVFRAVDIPADRSAAVESDLRLVRQFEIKSFPTMVVLDAQYKELSRQVGSGPPVENYKAWIRQHASYY